MSWRTRDASAFGDALAARLRAAAADLQPSPAFQTSLRATLMGEAAVVLAGGPAITAHRRSFSVPVTSRRRVEMSGL